MSQKPLIIITGASSGIGETTAKALSKRGHPLLLLARRIERLEAMGLPETLCRKTDVTDLEAFIKAVAEAETLYGPTDCLINNAGVMLLSQIVDQNPAEWKHMMDVNVLGILNGIHSVLKGMIERKTGTIMNLSSIAGKKTFPNHAVYCGTKFAVHSMSENLREEVAKHNVRIITIAPGAVDTELLSHTTNNSIKTDYENWKKEIGGVLDAQTVTKAILFAYEQPQSVCIREIALTATGQEP